MDEKRTEDVRTSQRSPASVRLLNANGRALANRPFLEPGYEFRPASVSSKDFGALKQEYPYFGYVEVEVEGVPPFLMFSNNDDRVAQRYFFYGPNAFESLSLRLWRELASRSSYVFDVGSFTGIYSMVAALANREARVYCFEPAREIFGRLLVNLKVNRLRRQANPFGLALSDTDGQAVFNAFMGYFGLPSGSSLVTKGSKDIVRQEHVETKRLDTFVEEHALPTVDLVKIDVERAEKMVIGGMGGVLERHRPHLIVEVFAADSLRDLVATLSPHGYNFAVIDDKSQEAHVNDFGAHTGSSNVLFSPTPPDGIRELYAAVMP